MKLYMVRHGETDWNIEGRVLGRTDQPLNQKGHRQAQETARVLQDIPFAVIYTSPLRRSLETAQCIAELGHEGCPVEILDCLTEQDFGSCEGADWYDQEFTRKRTSYFARLPGGESTLDVAVRVYPFLHQLQDKWSGEAGNLLIVTHSSVCRLIRSYFENMDNDAFGAFQMDNCQVLSYEL